MKSKIKALGLLSIVLLMFVQCKQNSNQNDTEMSAHEKFIENQLSKYVEFKLESDISHLSQNQRQMLVKLFEVAEIMDDIFKAEVLPNYQELYDSLKTESEKKLFTINYGPWNRIDGNSSFVKGIGEKPLGANYYPADMSKEEFEAWNEKDKDGLYSFVRRDEQGNLKLVPYHQMFEKEVKRASQLLKEAAALAEDKDFKKYLELRAEALLTDEYFESDMAWMSMKDNKIDMVVGPIENYEDQLYAYKTTHEAFILIKDLEWTEKLAKYSSYLPALQKGLPVDEQYKAEEAGSDSDLGAYDVVYYAGDCNAGSKTIAINLPNDEKVQLAKGSRRLQLKNAMKAKFDNILLPISDILIDKEQRKHVKFDAFFANTMFHEVAHGLGIKNTINGMGNVRKALKEQYSGIEEGKADILGLYMVDQLIKMQVHEGDIRDNMVTFMAGLFRSIRFGATSAHAKANLMRFNYFAEQGAFALKEDGTYTVDFAKMEAAMNSLSAMILKLQGDGDYQGVLDAMEKYGNISKDLEASLDKLSQSNIPVDVIWNQGKENLGL